MKKFYIAIFTILGIIASIILHFGFSQFYSLVSNYANLSKYELSGLPMYFLIMIIVALFFYFYRYFALHKKDGYTKRLYSILIIAFSFLGFVSSILVGTLVYQNLFTRFIFLAYPFIMMLAHLAFLGAGIYYLIISLKEIKNGCEKPQKSGVKHVFYTIGMAFLLMYSLVKMGSLFLLPILYSPYDGFYIIPLYVQFLVPMASIFCYLYYRDFAKNEIKSKFTVISSSVILGLSLITFFYVVFVGKLYYPNIINASSNVIHLERLITIPINFIILYICSIFTAISNLIIVLIKKVKKSK